MHNESAQGQAWTLVLQHPKVSLDARTLCRLLCSSKAIRIAAQQSGGTCTSVRMQLYSYVNYSESFAASAYNKLSEAARLAQFALWLPQHACLVKHIDMDAPVGARPPAGWRHATADALVSLALRQAGTAGSPKHPINRSNGEMCQTAQGSTQQDRRDRQSLFLLHSFNSSIHHTSAVLAALPASLTSLGLQLTTSPHPVTQTSALAQLSSLQDLKLGCFVSEAWLAPLQHLITSLTSLSLEGLHAAAGDLKCLPATLRTLCLPDLCLTLDRANNERMLNLAHLTGVTALQLQSAFELNVGCNARAVCIPSLAITRLQHLQRLQLSCCYEIGLLELADMSQLTSLTLVYSDKLGIDVPVDDALVWEELPQLHCLTVQCDGRYGDHGWTQIVDGVSSASNLTRLHLHMFAETDYTPVRLLDCLTALSSLQDLTLIVACDANARVPTDDATALTVLSSLTKLDLSGWNVGEAAVVDWAFELQRLKHLALIGVAIKSLAVMPAIGRLRHLEHFQLSDDYEFSTSECLLWLTQFTGLTSLHL